MKLVLRREPPHSDCTLGLLHAGDLTLCTIERPWIPSPDSRGGKKGVSCVPAGTYRLERHNSDAHPMTWALVNPDLDVSHYPNGNDRSAVLIHPANWAFELRGCIAPGTRAEKSDRGFMVVESRKAFRLLQELLPWTDEHTLEITA